MESTSARIHPHSPVPSAAFVAHQVSTRSIHSSPYYSPPASSRHGRMENDSDSPSMSRSPSVSSVRSYFSRESSPYPSEQSYGPSHHHGGLASPASTSMTSLSVSLSSNNSSSVSLAVPSSSSPIPPSTPLTATSPQLLLCPVCSRPFKPSKNQNCNLRRHLKNVHNMSPAMHPRKCKWDSLPDGRVKDDKDRKERTRKSKRLWARKFRLRRKVEEAAMVLSMLSQAM
ncbi:hypothetical protein BG011_002774 [Mortierella polycephala]|uniref:Uncharacterized protein n=1 Tax=Mortierella polycephala TaxID=41804 RepID=A0A9P6Q6P0_9FUNG|nr:hypothetical protein BG011_002774 [Mortierella polycephala]